MSKIQMLIDLRPIKNLGLNTTTLRVIEYIIINTRGDWDQAIGTAELAKELKLKPQQIQTAINELLAKQLITPSASNKPKEEQYYDFNEEFDDELPPWNVSQRETTQLRLIK